MLPNTSDLLVDIRVETQLPRKCTTEREIVETVIVKHITVKIPRQSNGRQLMNDANSAYLEEQLLTCITFAIQTKYNTIKNKTFLNSIHLLSCLSLQLNLIVSKSIHLSNSEFSSIMYY